MNVLDTLKYTAERIKMPMMIASVPSIEEGGVIKILFANEIACDLFDYEDMEGKDVKDLMPQSIALSHSQNVSNYVENYETIKSSRRKSVIGSWRDLYGIKSNGDSIAIRVNVADIKNSEERYFLALFQDRTKDVEEANQLQEALNLANKAKLEAEASKAESDLLREKAEDSLLKEKKLTGQISLLRQIFGGTMALVGMLGALIIVSWITGHDDSKDALAMIERVLLVMTGILGSAMASVFDSKYAIDKK